MERKILYLSYCAVSAVQWVATKRKKIVGVPAELTPDQKTLSGLIEAVYLDVEGKHEKAMKILEDAGYQKVGIDETIQILTPSDGKREEIRIQVFGRSAPQQADERGIKSRLPDHVLAIRGTILPRVSDISDDYRVLMQDLHNSPGYGHIKKTITSAIDKYKGEICVAGHSLGAAFGLLVTRELALNDQHIETHLFNPPFVTPDVLRRKAYKLLIKPVEYIVQSWNSQQLGSALRTAMLENVRLLQAPESLDQKIKDEFSKLQKSRWQPNLYLNPQDSVCNTYIDYFEDPGKFLARSLSPNSFHMIPKATVIINQKSSLLDMLASHANAQWFENLTQNLIHKRYYIESPDFQNQRNGLPDDGRAERSAANSGLHTPSSTSAPNEDLIYWASLEEVSSNSDGANSTEDSSAKSSLKSPLQLQVPKSADTNASSSRWSQLNDGRIGSPDTMSGTEELTLSAFTTAEQQGGSDNTLNVLLLGVTGVGKSTFINALYNYLTFDSFEDACAGDLRTLIYSQFHFRGKDITCGKQDDAEGAKNKKPGSSCTQKCRAYTFTEEEENQKVQIRLIDTPGIVDTNGLPRDEEHMRDTLSYISRYEVLHAVCILLKPNEVRLTPALKYSIVQLLAHLHKDATRNILFCFTNSSPSMFDAGDTLPLLKHVLSESPQTAAIKLDDETIYYFDSEAFRFLACEKSGLEFKAAQKNVFKSSWEQSSLEASRLIKHIASLEPHDVKSTLSLNLVKDVLAGIEGPLAMIAEAIKHNLELSRRNTREIHETHGSNAAIRKALIIEEEVAVTVKLDKSRTICKSLDCKGRICHEPCEVRETYLGTGQDILFEKEYQLFCKKFSLTSSECRECKCSRSSHVRVSTVTTKEVRKREDENIRKEIDKAEGAIQEMSKIVLVLEERVTSYQDEMNVVLNAAALFAGFLAQNSIVVYHSAIVEFFESQIEMKKNSGDQDTDEDEAHLRAYKQKLQRFKTRSGSSSSKGITIGDVKNELQKLYALGENGDAIRKAMQGIEEGYVTIRRTRIRREEVTCILPAPCPPAAGSSSRVQGRTLRSILPKWPFGHDGGDKRTKNPQVDG